MRLEKVRGEIEAPHRYQTTFGWVVRLAAVSLIVAWLAYRISDEWWIGVAILAAGALALMDFRIAEGTGNRFTIFAVAVFFSLPLYGAVVSLLILANEPLVQPAALIRGGGEGRTVVEGLYIADSDSHIYFGAVATDGCQSTKLRPGSGTIFAIPKSEVLDLRVGRGQGPCSRCDSQRPSDAPKPSSETPARSPDRRTPA